MEIPDPKCALNFNSPFELLVATVLSAQTTDKRVNMVTPELFGEYPGPAELAAANPSTSRTSSAPSASSVRKRATSSGCRMSCACDSGRGASRYGFAGQPAGRGPQNRERGVGQRVRRARFSCGHACDSCDWAIAVAVRLGEPSPDPVAIEREVTACFLPKEWTDLSHRLILHGRAICHARKPDCADCPSTTRVRARSPRDSDACQPPRRHSVESHPAIGRVARVN